MRIKLEKLIRIDLLLSKMEINFNCLNKFKKKLIKRINRYYKKMKLIQI